jgi:3-methyladenine DNA glycosylase AlkD
VDLAANSRQLGRIVVEIRSFCRANADAKQAERYQRFFNEGYDPYGIPDKVMLPQREKWFEQHKELGLPGMLELGDLLFESGKYEEAFIAMFFAGKFRSEFRSATFRHFGRWLDSGVRNWAHSDVLCGSLLSWCLVNDVVGLPAMDRWRTAKSKWKRRAVPVSMIPILKTEQNFRPLLDFIDPLMSDSERVVHQGLGWFLREAWKRQPGPVEKFLLRWKDTSARLIFQYATEKMTAAQKAKFRAGKNK